MGSIILLLILFLGPLLIYVVTLLICALDDTLERMWLKHIDEYEQLKAASNSNRESYSNSAGMDEGCMLFMGDAILRGTHDRHAASMNDNHNNDSYDW